MNCPEYRQLLGLLTGLYAIMGNIIYDLPWKAGDQLLLERIVMIINLSSVEN